METPHTDVAAASIAVPNTKGCHSNSHSAAYAMHTRELRVRVHIDHSVHDQSSVCAMYHRVKPI